ncbi:MULTISPECIES: RAxF-45 family protein [Sediminibacillus]|uniref:Uncharacterized protein n=1 Tax=Sediminibacillus halophilus TaxID=482461 RepID=A0A1G9WSW9_9BACI|nr:MULTISPECIES: RAxF-45 family protein [Sediminibacillus]SDM87285.1 hypothetical protein SAMN05216244_3602 [Sediminibacillus halophilus]
MPYTETHASYKSNLYMYRAIIHDLAANGIRMSFFSN